MKATPEQPIRVMLVEDHKIVRQGLLALLESQPDIAVVGEAADGRAALSMAEQCQPDVALMDLGMPGLNGVDTTRQLLKKMPSLKVVVLSMHASEEYVRPAIRAGAQGYLLKGSGLSDLVTAIRAVAEGEAFFSPAVARILLHEVQSRDEEASELLSPREREILQLVAEGHSGPQIAQLLSISPKTVESHRGRIMKKLDIHHVAGLVRYAAQIGLIEI